MRVAVSLLSCVLFQQNHQRVCPCCCCRHRTIVADGWCHSVCCAPGCATCGRGCFRTAPPTAMLWWARRRVNRRFQTASFSSTRATSSMTDTAPWIQGRFEPLRAVSMTHTAQMLQEKGGPTGALGQRIQVNTSTCVVVLVCEQRVFNTHFNSVLCAAGNRSHATPSMNMQEHVCRTAGHRR